MRQTFNQEKWQWYDLEKDQTDELEEIISKYPACSDWYKKLNKSKFNYLQVNTEVKGEEYIWGSLIYSQDIHEKGDNDIFHFYISRELFITIDFDFSVLEASSLSIYKKMDQAENGVEGFFVLLGDILSSYLLKIDEYEERLHDLLWQMKTQNNRELLEEIYLNRHELLVWKNLLVPITELKFIAEEAYGSQIRELPEFSRVATRVNRMRIILAEYQQEIDTMINLEEVVSTHRGNEIMKTLTVITTLFTPIMAWGALWGMNFKVMPELEWKLGYALAGVLIVLSTIALYVYLRMKGWMGDILKSKGKNSFFK